ncbi:tyrosine-type recombinase/integrase [Porticoccaceae bacterium LTM1]|nr:tyrosine-type recombinase/integrase [Porticoccaceae bacterium LTM1]
MRFTEKSVASLTPRATAYTIREKNSKGFTLRVHPSGTKTFYYERVHLGKKRRTRLGSFPTTSVKEARTHFQILSNTPEFKLEEQAGQELLVPLVRKFLKAKKAIGCSAKTLTNYQNYLDLFIEDHGGRKKASVSDLTTLNVQRIHVFLTEEEGKPTTANRVKETLSSFCTWLVRTGRMSQNPCLGLKGNREQVRKDYLNKTHLTQLVKAVGKSAAHPDTLHAVKIILQTGCRISEVCEMQRHELNLQERAWVIPASRNKSNREHLVWLPEWLCTLLEEHLATHSSLYVLNARSGATGYLSHFTVRQALERLCKTAGIPRTRPHDLRRTVGTILAQLGFPREMRKRYLNHAEEGVTDIHYNAYDYFPENKEMAEAVAGYLRDCGLN